MTRAIEARVSGRVQAVGFRYWTQERAEKLGITGWVRNEWDGDVTAHLEGDDQSLAKMIRELHKGPRWSHVQDVTTSPARVRGAQSFEIVY